MAREGEEERGEDYNTGVLQRGEVPVKEEEDAQEEGQPKAPGAKPPRLS